MRPERGADFMQFSNPSTFGTQEEINMNYLPSLSAQNEHERFDTTRIGRLNYSVEEARPNTGYGGFIRSYTNPEVRPSRIPQTMSSRAYDEPVQSGFRQGRLGAPWRHVQQCTGNLGNHICYIDGNVKLKDMNRSYGYEAKNNAVGKFTHYSYDPKYSMTRKVPAVASRPNKFNKHAKNGFRYWYEEKPGVSAFARYSMGMAGNPYGIPGTSLPAMKGTSC